VRNGIVCTFKPLKADDAYLQSRQTIWLMWQKSHQAMPDFLDQAADSGILLLRPLSVELCIHVWLPRGLLICDFRDVSIRV